RRPWGLRGLLAGLGRAPSSGGGRAAPALHLRERRAPSRASAWPAGERPTPLEPPPAGATEARRGVPPGSSTDRKQVIVLTSPQKVFSSLVSQCLHHWAHFTPPHRRFVISHQKNK
uniref:Uncharacterized protein n=1 Tax=Mustela putorius furo TaxID=9669 RepID=M3XU83_MUSPF